MASNKGKTKNKIRKKDTKPFALTSLFFAGKEYFPSTFLNLHISSANNCSRRQRAYTGLCSILILQLRMANLQKQKLTGRKNNSNKNNNNVNSSTIFCIFLVHSVRPKKPQIKVNNKQNKRVSS